MKKLDNRVKGYISSGKNDGYFKEQFKGEVSDKLVRWPKELGVEHPFSFEDCEKVYKKFGLVSGIINKNVDHTVGEFTIESDNDNVVKVINEFIKKNNFSVILRDWIRESLMKGNGFMEINVQTKDCKIIGANDMYVVRNRKGEVTGYNQYIGDLVKFNQKKIIPFTPNQIAHLPFNKIAGEAYGYGYIYPNERVIENLILNIQDVHKLISRKAGAPLWAKCGIPGEATNPGDVDAMKANMQYLNNSVNWATDANVDLKVVDFGPLGEKLTGLIEHDIRELCAGMDMPEVLLNSGQLNEGIAKTQIAGWKMKIMNFQDMIEGIILEKIFKPLLEANQLKGEEVDFIWNLPSDEDINLRLTQLNTILGNMSATENMKRLIQLEIARLLNIQEANLYLPSPEEGLDEQNYSDKKDIAKMGVGLVPDNSKPIPDEMKKKVPFKPQSAHLHEIENIDYNTITMREWLNLQEVAGFTYSDYLVAILKQTKIDKFQDLKAVTEADISNGLFPEADIEKLRTILKEGFRRNLTLRQIETNIKESINIKDRITEDGKSIPAQTRTESITRTETLRLSSIAIKNLYDDNNINKFQFLSSPGACDICQALDNGEIKLLSEANTGTNYPPIHPNCRCFPMAVR
jgi:SPP1 gp7 family putative phage head morphogenesis protein